MQAYRAFYEKGKFIPTGTKYKIPEGAEVLITVLDESVKKRKTKKRIAQLDEIFNLIKNSNEEIPEFERIRFTRLERVI